MLTRSARCLDHIGRRLQPYLTNKGAIRVMSQHEHDLKSGDKGKIRGVTIDSIGAWDNRLDLPVNIEQSIKTGSLIPELDLKKIGSATANGRRKENNDAYLIKQLTPDIILLGMFDGHGGSIAAEFTRDHVDLHIVDLLESGVHQLVDILHKTFIDVNTQLTKYLKNNYYDNDIKLMAGTTATVCLIRNSVELVVANVGDSHAVLCRDGKAIRLTTDHSTDDDGEVRRIKQAGGKITGASLGRPRVNGRLNMTRSIGDMDLKEFGVTAEPDVRSIKVPYRVIMEIDGKITAEEAAMRVTDQALHFGTEDNVTAIVMPLGAWGKFTADTRVPFRFVGSRHS